jgi:CheY-like chemotaxis protein
MNLTPLNLLLADDDTDDCLFFKEALEELQINAKLTIVNDGEQLMQLLSKGNLLPHVLYLDLNMPRKNGFECLTEIKQNAKLQQLPVIIFSTSFDLEVVNLTHDRGAHLYICKPAEFGHLKKVISKSIDFISQSPQGQLPKEKYVLTAV